MDNTEGFQQNNLHSNAAQSGAIASNRTQLHADASTREQLQNGATYDDKNVLKPFSDNLQREVGSVSEVQNSALQNPTPQDTANASNDMQSHKNAMNRETVQEGTVVSAQPPSDDEYFFTLKGAIQYALKQDCIIPERTLYDNCQHGRKRKTLLCWKSDGVNSETYIGKNSLDKFIRNRLASDAIDEVKNNERRELNQSSNVEENIASSPSSQSSDEKHEPEVDALKEKITKLEKKLIDAEVEKRAAHQARDFVVQQNDNMLRSFNETKYELGMAHNQLKALGAPVDNSSEGEGARQN